MHALVAAALLCTPAAVSCACSMSITGVTFGTYNPANSTATTFSGSVQVTCTSGSGFGSYNIQLSTGSAGTYAGRRMAAGSFLLPYQLYRESAKTTIWGDGTGGSQKITGIDSIPHTGGTTVYPVYGRIAAGLATNPGSFLDNITVILTY